MMICVGLIALQAATLSATLDKINHDDQVEHFFSEGVILYRNGQYQDARDRFLAAVERPIHQRYTIALLMAAKSQLMLGAFNEAIALANRLLSEFPRSKYVDDARFVRASAYYNLGNTIEALKNLLTIINTSETRPLVNKCEELAIQIIDVDILKQKLPDLLLEFSQGPANGLLTVKIAYHEIVTSQAGKAKERLNTFLQGNPDRKYARAANDLMAMADNYVPSTLNVGVVLPFSGYFANEGRDLLYGMQFALKKFEALAPIKIKIVPRDSEGRTLNAVKSAQGLIDLENLITLVGELESNNTIGITAVTESGDVPLLIPTVTENGITLLGNRTFQLNNDLRTRGSKLAQYAIDRLGLKSFATLAPADDYGKGLTDAFVETVDKMGGQVVAEMWYYEGTENIVRQLQSIREAGLRYEARDKLESLGIRITRARIDSTLNSMRAEYHLTFRRQNETDRATLLSDTEVPIRSIDGIFMPIYREDIPFVVPQFLQQNIRAQMLGGDYWFEDVELLRQMRVQVNNIIFVSGRFWQDYDPEIRNFTNEFRKMFGATPGIFAYYGYDTMQLIIQAIENGVRTRDAFVKYLETLDDFEGLRGMVSFAGSNRVNSRVHILQFKDGLVNKLE